MLEDFCTSSTTEVYVPDIAITIETNIITKFTKLILIHKRTNFLTKIKNLVVYCIPSTNQNIPFNFILNSIIICRFQPILYRVNTYKVRKVGLYVKDYRMRPAMELIPLRHLRKKDTSFLKTSFTEI